MSKSPDWYRQQSLEQAKNQAPRPYKLKRSKRKQIETSVSKNAIKDVFDETSASYFTAIKKK